MRPKDLPLFRHEAARKLLREACDKHGIKLSLLQDLLEIQRKYAGVGKQIGITSDFSGRLAEYIEDEDK